MNSSHKILILNRLWQAINIVGIQRAFSLLLQNNAQVINTGDSSFQVMDSTAWLDYSVQQEPGEDEACIQTVCFADSRTQSAFVKKIRSFAHSGSSFYKRQSL